MDGKEERVKQLLEELKVLTAPFITTPSAPVPKQRQPPPIFDS